MDWHLRAANAALQNDTSLLCSIWSQLWRQCRKTGGTRSAARASGSHRIHLHKVCLVEPKDDTDVSLRPRQPSVTGSRPSRTGAHHVVKLVGGLRWPVITSWKLSFQHGWLPAMANHASVWTEDRWKKHTFTQKCLDCMSHSNVKNILHNVFLRAVISLFELQSLWNADAKTIFHDVAFIKKHYWWKCVVLAKSLERVKEFSTSVHLFHSWLLAIYPRCCTIVSQKAPGSYTNVTPPLQICPSYTDFSSASELRFVESTNPIKAWNLTRIQQTQLHTFHKI